MNLIINRQLDGAQKQVIYELTLKKRQSKKSTMSEKQVAARQQLARELLQERKIPPDQTILDQYQSNHITQTHSFLNYRQSSLENLIESHTTDTTTRCNNNYNPLNCDTAAVSANESTITSTDDTHLLSRELPSTSSLTNLLTKTNLHLSSSSSSSTAEELSSNSCCSFCRSDSSYSGSSQDSGLPASTNGHNQRKQQPGGCNSSTSSASDCSSHHHLKHHQSSHQLLLDRCQADELVARKKEASLKFNKSRLEHLNYELERRLHQYEYLIAQEKALLGTYNLKLFAKQGVNNFHLSKDDLRTHR